MDQEVSVTVTIYIFRCRLSLLRLYEIVVHHQLRCREFAHIRYKQLYKHHDYDILTDIYMLYKMFLCSLTRNNQLLYFFLFLKAAFVQ